MDPVRLSAAVIACVLFAAACTSPNRANGPTQVRAASVDRGPVQQRITASGSVQARAPVNVQPETNGRVREVAVDVGAEVHAGDVIARLQDDSPRVAVNQAQANLLVAQAKLSTVEAGARPDDVAQAAQALNQQQLKLAAMQSQGRPEDVAAAHSAYAAQLARLNMLQRGGRPEAVQQAQSALDAAQQKLRLLQNGATDDVRQAAVSAVNADTAAVVAAEAQYAALGGSSAADLQALQSQVEALGGQVSAAEAGFTASQAALSAVKGSSQADIAAAQTAYDQAQAALRTAQAALDQANRPTQVSLAQAQAAVAAAQAQRSAAEANQTALEQKATGVCAPLINPATGQAYVTPNSTACGEAKAAAASAVQAGDAAIEATQGQLDQLTRGGAPAARVALEAQVASAAALVNATRVRLDALRTTGVAAQQAQLQAQSDLALSQLTSARESLKSAQARLAAAQDGTLDAQRKAVQSQLTASRSKLTADQSHLEELVAGPPPEEVQVAQDAVDQAVQQVALVSQPATDSEIAAQQALVEQTYQQVRKAAQPYTEYDIAQQQAAVAQAEAALRARQTPYTEQDLTTAQAQVEQAQSALDQAVLTLANTQVLAPVDGYVADRQVSAGALVSPQTSIVTLTPPSLLVNATVDDTSLGAIHVTQPVTLQVSAYPNLMFEGTVGAVAPTVDPKTHTASVRIDPVDTQHLLRPGMLAMITFVVMKPDVLVVPRDAVQGSVTPGAVTTVVTVEDSRANVTTVHLGQVDEQVAEVASGLSPGELVVTPNQNTLKTGDPVLVLPAVVHDVAR